MGRLSLTPGIMTNGAGNLHIDARSLQRLPIFTGDADKSRTMSAQPPKMGTLQTVSESSMAINSFSMPNGENGHTIGSIDMATTVPPSKLVHTNSTVANREESRMHAMKIQSAEIGSVWQGLAPMARSAINKGSFAAGATSSFVPLSSRNIVSFGKAGSSRMGRLSLTPGIMTNGAGNLHIDARSLQRLPIFTGDADKSRTMSAQPPKMGTLQTVSESSMAINSFSMPSGENGHTTGWIDMATTVPPSKLVHTNSTVA